MDSKTRQRAHELERQARSIHPASAVNQLCVMVAKLEQRCTELEAALAELRKAVVKEHLS